MMVLNKVLLSCILTLTIWSQVNSGKFIQTADKDNDPHKVPIPLQRLIPHDHKDDKDKGQYVPGQGPDPHHDPHYDPHLGHPHHEPDPYDPKHGHDNHHDPGQYDPKYGHDNHHDDKHYQPDKGPYDGKGYAPYGYEYGPKCEDLYAPDPHDCYGYMQIDQYGGSFNMICPLGTHWSQKACSCVHGECDNKSYKVYDKAYDKNKVYDKTYDKNKVYDKAYDKNKVYDKAYDKDKVYDKTYDKDQKKKAPY